jgi:predicted methyltransferase
MIRLALALLILVPAAAAAQDDFTATADKIRAAMAADIRTAEEVERDPNRRPLETLEFMGLRDDMKVVELIPGGGWYTKLLAPVLAARGEYYAAIGTSRIKESLAGQPGFEKMNIVAEDAKVERPEGARLYTLQLGSLGVEGADLVLTFRNYHNFDAAGRASLNQAVYDALKPGGIYGVVDHTRRHMQGDDPENRRRMDPVLVIKEVQAAGFELVDFSDLHYTADDELRYEVGRKTVTGNSDRFTLKFVRK